MRIFLAILIALLAALAGCEGDSPRRPAGGAPPQAPPAVQAPGAPKASNAVVETPKPVEPIREKADVGMGEKGRGYGEGFVATPIKALWSVRERTVLIQIESAMQLYKAANEHGLPMIFTGRRHFKH